MKSKNTSELIKIIKKINKYNYFIVNKKKSILLGSDTSNTASKLKVYKKLGNKINKYIGKTLVRIKVGLSKNIDNKKILNNMIGGPIFIKMERYRLTGVNKLQKIEKVVNYFFYQKKELIDGLDKISQFKNDLKLLAFVFMNDMYNMSAFNIKYVKKIIENVN
tara:strand:+ start:7816 stop:8304 length:489 start_codon:yes stop_codon:yes gene_type:complete